MYSSFERIWCHDQLAKLSMAIKNNAGAVVITAQSSTLKRLQLDIPFCWVVSILVGPTNDRYVRLATGSS